MENCVVTKLSGVVNNEEIPILGYDKYRIRMDLTGRGAYLRVNKMEKLILLDGKWSSNNSREYVLNADTSFYANKDNILLDAQDQEFVTILVPRYTCYAYGNLCPLEGEYTIEYNGYKFGSAENEDNVELYTGAIIIELPNRTCKIKGLEYFPFAKAKVLNIYGMGISETVDISMLGASGKLLVCNLGNVYDLTGSLNNVGFSNISEVACPFTKNVSIDIVTFVQNARTAGRTTGSVNFTYIGAITVKANGVALTVPIESQNILSWTADSITFRGEPIS